MTSKYIALFVGENSEKDEALEESASSSDEQSDDDECATDDGSESLTDIICKLEEAGWFIKAFKSFIM